MSTKFDEWREAGFSETEIQDYLQAKIPEWRGAGFGDKDVRDYLGLKEFDPLPLKETVLREVDQRNPDWRNKDASPKGFLGLFEKIFLPGMEDFRKSLSPEELASAAESAQAFAKTPVGGKIHALNEAFSAGMQGSVAGLVYRNKLPDMEESVMAAMPWDERITRQIGQLAGDLPFLMSGGFLGGVSGGPAAPVTSMAGAFGLTEGLRRLYIDKINKGEIQGFKGDFSHRLNDALWDTMKGLATGATTKSVGIAAGGGWTGLGAEIPTLVGISAGLEGRVPEPAEFFDAAVLLVGLKAAGKGSAFLKEHYAKTGETPTEVIGKILKENEIAGEDIPSWVKRREEVYRAPQPQSVEERLGGIEKGEAELPRTTGLFPDQRAKATSQEEAWRRQPLSEEDLRQEAEPPSAGPERAPLPEGLRSIEGLPAVDELQNLRPDQRALVEGRTPPTARELGISSIDEWNRRQVLEGKRGFPPGEQTPVDFVNGTRNVQNLNVGSEDSAAARDPKSRFWMNWKGNLADREASTQEIADKALDSIRPKGERERTTDIRSSLQALLDEEAPGRVVGNPEGVAKKGPFGSQTGTIDRELLGLGDRGKKEDRLLPGVFKRKIEETKGWVEGTVEGTDAILKDVFVDTEYRNRGLGTREVEKLLVANPEKTFWIAAVSKEMERVAEKLGFEKVAEKGKKGEELPVDTRFSNATVWKKGPEISASYAYTDSLSGRPVDYFEIKGGPRDGSSLPREKIEELGVKISKERSAWSVLGSEDGFIDVQGFAEALARTKDWVKEIGLEAPFLLKQPYYWGKEGGKELLNLRNQLISMPYWRAAKDPIFKKYFDIQNTGDEAKASLAFKFLSKVDPLFKLRGKDYNDYKTVALESDRSNYEYKNLAEWDAKHPELPISQKAFDVYKLVRATFDESHAYLVNFLRRNGADQTDIQEIISTMNKVKGYFPRIREGKYFLEYSNEEGQRGRAHYWNEGQEAKLRKELETRGFKVTSSGEVPKIPDEMYGRVDTSSLGAILDEATQDWEAKQKAQLFQDVSEVIRGRGFMARGIKRSGEFVEGFESDNLKKVVLEHFMGLSGMITKAERSKQFREQFYKDFSENKLDNAHKEEISKYVNDMLSPTSDAARLSGKIRSLLFAKYMYGVAKSAVVNLTGNFIAAVPRLSLETNFASVKLSKAMIDIVDYAVRGENTLPPEQVRALRIMLQNGYTQDMYTQELMGNLRSLGTVGQIVGKTLGAPMEYTEKWNRMSTGLAAFRVFREEKGFSFEASIAEAKEVILDAHGLYGKSNLPGLFRGSNVQDLARTAYTFRTYQHNYLNLLGKLMREDPIAVAKSLAAVLILGGLGSTFAYKSLEGLLQRNGINPRSEIKKWGEENGFEELSTFINYGLPGLAGVDLSGSLGMEPFGDRAIAAGQPGEVANQAAVDIFGVPGGIVEDIAKAAQQLYHGDYGRAVEEAPFTPQFVSNLIAGHRISQEGLTTRMGDLVRSSTGEQETLSPTQIALKAVGGFQPMKLSEHYREAGVLKAEQARWASQAKDLTIEYKKAVSQHGLESEEATRMAEKIGLYNTTKPIDISPINISTLIHDMLPVKPPTGRQIMLRQRVQ